MKATKTMFKATKKAIEANKKRNRENASKFDTSYKLSSYLVYQDGIATFCGNFYATLDFLGITESALTNLIRTTKKDENQYNRMKRKFCEHNGMDDWTEVSDKRKLDPIFNHKSCVYVNQNDSLWEPIQIELLTNPITKNLSERKTIERAFCNAALNIVGRNANLEDLAFDYDLNYDLLLDVYDDLYTVSSEDEEFFWNFLDN
jgi:hypothetical protein